MSAPARAHRLRWLVRALVPLLAATGLMLAEPQPESADAAVPGCLAGEVVDVAASGPGGGYWAVGSDGGVFSFGDAPYFGSMGGRPLNRPVVDIVATANGQGYWLIAADGGVFAFGNAASPANNPLPGLALNSPVVAGARAGAGGLWLTAGDGGVFALGGAPFHGSMGGRPLNRPVVDVVSTAAGGGYWLIGEDGGVFAFGDAQPVAGNPLPSSPLNQPIVGAARSGNGAGLWLTAGDGGVFALNGAPFHGSASTVRLAKPVSGIAAPPSGGGYWLAARDGGVFAYGSAGFFGNAVSTNCAAPAPTSSTAARIVQIATDIQERRAVAPWAGGPVPYVWGGGHRSAVGPSLGTCDRYTGSIQPCPAERTVGVDCSGFTRWVYHVAFGRDVLGSGNTNSHLALMRPVSSPQPGDLVFFGSSTSNTTHVGIVIGNGRMINAPATGSDIRTDAIAGRSGLVGYYRF